MLVGLAIFTSGVGISYINIHQTHNVYEGVVVTAKDNYFLLSNGIETYYAYQKDNAYEIGDILAITGSISKLESTAIESQFDFTSYLNYKGIEYQLKIDNVTIKHQTFLRLKEYRKEFLSIFDENSAAIINAILFSNSDSGEISTNLAKLHVGRLVSASGVYLYAYLSFLSLILSFLLKKKWADLISGITLLPYIVFTFPRFTPIRIMTIYFFRWFNEHIFKKKLSSFSILGITGISFLLFNKFLGYQDSFLLGFLIPPINRFIKDVTFKFKGVKKKIIEILFLYIAFIPFEIKFYNGVNPLSSFLTILLTPVMVLLGIFSLLCFYKLPIDYLINWYAKGINNLTSWMSKIAFQINCPPLNAYSYLIFYLLFVLILYYQSIQFTPIYRPLKLFLLIGLVFYCIPLNNFVSEEVSFINVGQGDACLIRKQNKTVLIDTGGSNYFDIAEESLIPYLEKKRIYKIDLLITTHDDLDHSGGVDSLKENFKVNQYITGTDSFPISFAGITFSNYNTYASEDSEDNEKSLVIGFSLLHKDFLITGDAPISIENKIMENNSYIPCDILKVGHHGSKTSSSEQFIKFLSPKEAVISVGKNNKYGHPHKEVLTILKNNNVIIKRTDELGTITYKNYIFM